MLHILMTKNNCCRVPLSLEGFHLLIERRVCLFIDFKGKILEPEVMLKLKTPPVRGYL